MSSSIARTAPAPISAAASPAGESCSPAAHTIWPFWVMPMPERATTNADWIVAPQQASTQLVTVAAATPRSTSSLWF